MNIKQAIEEIVKAMIPTQAFLAEVVSVDKEQCTVELKTVNDDLELADNRLRAVIDQKDTGMIIWPKVGSIIMAALINNDINSCAILMYSELEKITINTDLVEFNGGELGGMVKAKELKQQLDKTNALLQAVVDSLLNWTPVASDGGAALKTFATTNLTGKTAGDFGNIENAKITH
jgi:hypothetical protein